MLTLKDVIKSVVAYYSQHGLIDISRMKLNWSQLVVNPKWFNSITWTVNHQTTSTLTPEWGVSHMD